MLMVNVPSNHFAVSQRRNLLVRKLCLLRKMAGSSSVFQQQDWLERCRAVAGRIDVRPSGVPAAVPVGEVAMSEDGFRDQIQRQRDLRHPRGRLCPRHRLRLRDTRGHARLCPWRPPRPLLHLHRTSSSSDQALGNPGQCQDDRRILREG
ncbi:uncharacterized protein LOC143034258 [Oratosquilla oratoria]|uniref:uncharacterized protein LOC143034258 n=1 Tax=Oratosquilla oratoria TaxID=337810 RepID=UPI003F775A43